MKNKTSKIVSALYFLCIVTCILLSAHLVSDVAARFKTEASGSDSARVAKFSVSAVVSEGQENDFALSFDKQTATYRFKVSSDSEVSVGYDVILEFPANVPEGVKITIDDKIATVDGKICTIYNVGTFSAGNYGEKEHTMKIEVSLFDEDSDLDGIKVTIVASQID